MKEKLEYFLSECDKIIKINEKISKGIIKIKNENENSMRKILSYISKINKNQKEIDILFNQSMKNINIIFDEEKSDLKFNEYFFNGGELWKLSNILNENDSKLIISWLPNKPSKYNLLFDTKRDGDYSSTFHDKCDGKSPTLIVINQIMDIYLEVMSLLLGIVIILILMLLILSFFL